MRVARYLGVAVGIGAALLVTPTAARTPPPPVCQTGRFVLPQGILVAPVTPPSKAIVLTSAGSVSIPGVCVDVSGKVAGIRRGTRVTVRWPAGACTGIPGVLRLTALIEPSCQSMRGTLRAKKLRRPFTANVPVCDPGFVLDTGGACVPNPFQTGTTTKSLTLDAGGCLAEVTGLATPLGVRTSLAAGTCFRTVDGALVTGGVELGIDDSGGPAALGSGADVKGVVRLFLRPNGGAVVAAVIDPPATLDLELGNWSLPGTWYTTAYLNGDRIAPGPVAGAVPVLLDAVPIEPAGPEHLRLDATAPLALAFTPAPATTGAAVTSAVTGSSTVSIVLPGAPTDADPRVCAWQLVNPGTAQVVVVGTRTDGIALGQSDTRLRASHAYTAAVVARGSERRLEVSSDFRNHFTLQARLCDEQPVAGDTQGGCPGESCTDGSYVGFVRATVQAATVAELLAVRDALAAKAPPPPRVIVRQITTLTGGDRQAIIDVEAPSSVNLLAAGLPPAWHVVTGDRTLAITVSPPPPPRAARIVKRISDAVVSAQVSAGALGDDTKEQNTPAQAPFDFGPFAASLPAHVTGDLDDGGHVDLAASVLHDSQLDLVSITALRGVTGSVAVSATDASTGLVFPDSTSTASALGQTDVWFEVEGSPLPFTATLDTNSVQTCDVWIGLWPVPAEGSSQQGTAIFDTNADEDCDGTSFPIQQNGTLPVGHYWFHVEGNARVSAGAGVKSDAESATFTLGLGSGS